jgi:arginase
MYDAWLLAGKELNDPRVLTDVGDVPVQEIRDWCG